MRRIRELARCPVVFAALAAFGLAAGFSATAGAGAYEACHARCQQRYQACVVQSDDDTGCYERLLQCQAVCNT